MAAKTGRGYERHGNRYRIKVTRPDGSRGYVSFESEREAADYVATGITCVQDVPRVAADR